MFSLLADLQKERGFPHPSRKKKLLKFKRESTRFTVIVSRSPRPGGENSKVRSHYKDETAARAGISSQVRPSSSRPAFFFLVPPHCLKKKGTRAPERFQSAFDKPMDSTKAGITTSLTVAYDYCIDGLKQMNDADLLKTAVFAGRSEPKLDIFWEAYAHATHGLGKADVYLRLKGITPPDTGPRYEF